MAISYSTSFCAAFRSGSGALIAGAVVAAFDVAGLAGDFFVAVGFLEIARVVLISGSLR
jgi:hypothetical protein